VISDTPTGTNSPPPSTNCAPANSGCTHGREEALARWAELHGVPARALALVGYEEEDDD